MLPRRKSTAPLDRPANPQDPSTWLKPGEPLIGADGRDWSWAYVWFKDVEGFPGYKVSWHGFVWSCWEREVVAGSGARGTMSGQWHRNAGNRNRAGYRVINLCRGGKAYRRIVHRLVLEAFVGPCPQGSLCRHLDGDRRNNRLSNLAWGTPRENQLDRVRHGTHLCGSQVGTAKLDESRVAAIRARFRDVPNKKRLAEEFGVDRSTIRAIVEGELWKHVDVVGPARKITRDDLRAINGRQRETLEELMRFAERSISDPEGCRWARPMDLGASDASHHSKTLKKLTRKGLVEQRRRGGIKREFCVYRISDAGRQALETDPVGPCYMPTSLN